ARLHLVTHSPCRPLFFSTTIPLPPTSPLFPYTTLFRSGPPAFAPGPTEEFFHPPKGWRRTIAPVIVRFTYALPTSTDSRHWAISAGSRLWIPPVRPKGVLFCHSIACSSDSAAMIPMTGPKYSVWWNSDP